MPPTPRRASGEQVRGRVSTGLQLPQQQTEPNLYPSQRTRPLCACSAHRCRSSTRHATRTAPPPPAPAQRRHARPDAPTAATSRTARTFHASEVLGARVLRQRRAVHLSPERVRLARACQSRAGVHSAQLARQRAAGRKRHKQNTNKRVRLTPTVGVRRAMRQSNGIKAEYHPGGAEARP